MPDELIARIEKLSPEPGDCLVLYTALRLNRDQLTMLREQLRDQFPKDVKVIVIDGSLCLELRKGSADELPS